MPNKLSSITKKLLLKAFLEIDNNSIPKDNEYNLYWLTCAGKIYPFKYSVELASSYLPIEEQKVTTDFQSTDGYRNTIANLGFPIQYKEWNTRTAEPNFYVGASYYGREPNLIPKFDDFIKNEYWRTDHDLTSGPGLKVFKLLQKMKINDRIAVRFLSRRNRTVEIAALGTITSISEILDGKISVKWDYNPRLFKGPVPLGDGAGNWSLTLIELKRPEDIELVFDYAKAYKRAARLTWNDNGYIYPSGKIGKSINKDSHEGKYGYGHEEWLLDTSKLLDGYHYGFLEPIRKHQSAYTNKVYDVWLYTLDGESKVRFWIGSINQVEVIDTELAIEIKQKYIDNGWLNEMEEQIKACGADDKGFSGYNGLDLFNIRFKPENMATNDPYVEIPEGNSIADVGRYSFLFMKEAFKLPEIDSSTPFTFETPVLSPGSVTKHPKKKRSIRLPRAVEITYIHKAISDNLTIKLREKYGDLNVNPEHTAGYGQNRVDIIVKDTDGLIFYEIKSYNSIMTCIREAIGQLFEYALWPNQYKAKKMVVVSQISPSENVKKYFVHLRERTHIPIYYQAYNLKTNSLSTEY
jgi:hypothetical protein